MVLHPQPNASDYDETTSDSSGDEQFFDANSSDDESNDFTTSGSTQKAYDVPDKKAANGDSDLAGTFKNSVTVESDQQARRLISASSSVPKEVTTKDRSETLKNEPSSSPAQVPGGSGSSDFAIPQPPPRRKKKTAATSIPAVIVGEACDSSHPVSELDQTKTVPESGKSRLAPNLTHFVDDIASIQGDLSVNDALLFGDRHSICVDELNEAKHVLEKAHEKKFEERSDFTSATCHRNSTSTLKDCDLSANADIPNTECEQEANHTRVFRQDSELDAMNQCMVRNIDTGETLPLSKVEEIVTKCMNPLNLHLMKLTNEYHSDAEETDGQNSIESSHEAPLDAQYLGEEESGGAAKTGKQFTMKAVKNLKEKIGKGAKGVLKGVKQGVHRHHREGVVQSDLKMSTSQEKPDSSYQPFRLKYNKKETADFDGLKLIQEVNDCKGAVWCMKWSVDGQLLAVAGQDQLLRVYCTSKSWKYFTQLRNKASGQQTSPCSTKDRGGTFSGSRSNSVSSCDNLSLDGNALSAGLTNSRLWSEDNTLSEEGPLLLFSAFRGHTADVLDISWSKNHFLLSSSMDKTVRLWHITRVECLCTLRHADFVTTIQFHPRDDRYFLSGSLDGKLRLWNIPDKRVTLWNEVMALPTQTRGKNQQPPQQSHGLITSSAFVQNGKFAVIGTYDGRVIFFSTDQLKYFTQLHVAGKGLSGGSAANQGPVVGGHDKKQRRSNKVTGIEGVDENKILVTTNDSRVRLYDLRDLSLACKYKGCVNVSSQIKASVSHDSKYIVCGSENSSFYIWRMHENTAIGQRRDKNQLWESVRILPSSEKNSTASGSQAGASGGGAGPRNPGIITAATFAPIPSLLDGNAKYIIATTDFNGTMRIFSK